jgi:hypothetical protein
MERIEKLKSLISDNDDGIGCWTHKLAIVFRCCGKVYAIQDKEAYYCVLFVPQCLCKPSTNEIAVADYNCYVQNVITDGNGCATLSSCYYSNEMFSTTRYNCSKSKPTPSDVTYLFPKECHEKLSPALQEIHDAGGVWVGAVSVHENLTRLLGTNGKVVVMTDPTGKCDKNDFCGDTLRGDLLHFHIHFDTKKSIILRDKYAAREKNAEEQNAYEESDVEMQDQDEEMEDQEKIVNTDNESKTIENFEDFTLLFCGRDERDADVWAYCDNNTEQFENVRGAVEERDKIISYIENINGANTEYGTPAINTYYGNKLLIYLLDLQNDPVINFYENEIYDKVQNIFKDDPENEEIRRWRSYDGNIHLFQTPGLFKTIQNVTFDAEYKWFVENVYTLTPVLFNRSKINYHCSKPNSVCLPNNEYGSLHSGYTNFDKEFVTRCLNKHYTVLLSDAIKNYARENGNTFEIGSSSEYNKLLKQYKIMNVNKYEKLWRFFDLANVYNFTRQEVHCYNNCRYTVKSGDGYVCNWHAASKSRRYFTLYNRYYNTAFNNLLSGVYNYFICNQHWNPDNGYNIKYVLPAKFVDTYLTPHESNHIHRILKSDMYKPNVITSAQQDSGEFGWPLPKDQHVLTSERKRMLVGLQRQLKHKLYEPDSGPVIKIKRRFETMCMEFENKYSI